MWKLRFDAHHQFFDAYEVSCRARTEDLLYSRGCFPNVGRFAPNKGSPDHKDSAYCYSVDKSIQENDEVWVKGMLTFHYIFRIFFC